jgi:hypothetical protein
MSQLGSFLSIMGIKWGYDLETGVLMARPALPVGTYGKIRLQRVPREGPLHGYRARTQVRDSDGRTRPVERSGRTKAAAENRLKEAIRDRIAVDAVSDEITGASKVDRLAEKWFTNGGSGTPWAATTTEQYRRVLDRNILPRLGALEIRSLTTGHGLVSFGGLHPALAGVVRPVDIESAGEQPR